MKTYLVGGAVRDLLLDIAVYDRDWVVVGGTPEAMLAEGFTQVKGDFPVFKHPESDEEYALARIETKVAPGYQGFKFDASTRVTLEQDLARRDLTINAMAQDEDGDLIDPYNGRDDLDAGLLRHVTPAFSEDPVRVLRIARFAAKLGAYGFRVAHSTHGLMKAMVASGEISALNPQRVWQEMKKAFGYSQPWRFFEVLHASGALAEIAPKFVPLMSDSGHLDASVSEAIGALKHVTSECDEDLIRFAVWGSYAVDSIEEAEALAADLKLEKTFADLLKAVCRAKALFPTSAVPKTLFEFLKVFQGLKGAKLFYDVILVMSYIQGDRAMCHHLMQASELTQTVSAAEFSGIQGRALGEAIASRQLEVIQEMLQ